MWSALTDNLFAGIAALTAAAGLVGAWMKFRPQIHPRQWVYRLAGFFSASKEREISLKSAVDWQKRAEYEEKWKDYWKHQAQECIKDFQQEMRKDERQWGDSHDGGGGTSSSGGAGPTQTARLTG